MERLEYFTNELKLIESLECLEFTKKAIENLPDYFFKVAASSTGKYHPQYALGEEGLVRHTKAAVRMASHMLSTECMMNEYNSSERDVIYASLLLHDGLKHGSDGSNYTVHEHPILASVYVMNDGLFGEFNINMREEISKAIASHMGQWNTNPRSGYVLNKPENKIQKIVHICDYLASRKDIEVLGL